MLLFPFSPPPPPLSPPFPRNRSLTGMVGTIKNFLSSCQKKTDFKPDDMALPALTDACQKVVAYIMECRRVLDMSLDGKNLEVVLLEFGIRIQRVIYDHVQQFVISENGLSTKKITFNFTTLFVLINTYLYDQTLLSTCPLLSDPNSKHLHIIMQRVYILGVVCLRRGYVGSCGMVTYYYLLYTGAMNIICDMNEYRKAVKEFSVRFGIVYTFWSIFLEGGVFRSIFRVHFLTSCLGVSKPSATYSS